jgi:hypothetical protein
VTADPPSPLIDALEALQECLERADRRAVIIGGLAASLLGRPRLTRDIDALADLVDDDLERFIETAAAVGIEPRLENARDFAVRSRALLLRHRASQIDIDLVMATLPFERDAVASGQLHPLGPVEIRLPRVEDLLVMKAIAHRPRDLADIEGLLLAHPRADLARARRWIGAFAEAAKQPALLEDFDRLVAAMRAPG